MQTIYIKKGTRQIEVIVDDDIYTEIKHCKFRISGSGEGYPTIGYPVVEGNKTKKLWYFLHWHITGKPIKGYVTDHKDGNRFNCSKENTRIITQRQNVTNKKYGRSSTLPGMCWSPRDNAWCTSIRIENKTKYIGGFKTEFEAFKAYREALHSIGEELLPEFESIYNELNQSNVNN